jgi:transposase
MGRRKSSREFKVEAVRLVKDRGVSVVEAARDLDVHENVLRKWIKEFGADPAHRRRGSRKASSNLAREGRFDYLLVESTGIPDPLRAGVPRLGRRTALTFPLFPPPQKN